MLPVAILAAISPGGRRFNVELEHGRGVFRDRVTQELSGPGPHDLAEVWRPTKWSSVSMSSDRRLESRSWAHSWHG
jgi:hypothetical protein